MRKSHPDLPPYHQRQGFNKKRVGTGNTAPRHGSIFANADSITVIGIGVLVFACLLCPLQVLIAQDAPPQEQTPPQLPTQGTQTPDTPDEAPTDETQTPDTPDEAPTDETQTPDTSDEAEAEETVAERLNPETDVP